MVGEKKKRKEEVKIKQLFCVFKGKNKLHYL